MQFYFFVMFLRFPNDMHEEKRSFFELKKKRITAQPTDGPTDGRTDRRTDRPSYRDARTHLKSDVPKVTVPDFWPSGVVVRSFFWGKDNRSDASSAASSATSSAASSAGHDNRSDASRVTPPLQS